MNRRTPIHTFGGGLEVYDRSTGCFVHHGHDPDDAQSLSADDIARFYEDGAGGLWIGTEMGGINHYDPTWAKFPSYRADALAAGADAFLVKGCPLEELLEAILDH